MRDPIDDELAFHFEQLKQERLAAGDSEPEAERYARRRLGNDTRTAEAVRDVSLYHRGESLLRHLRLAWRSFRHHSGAYGLATAILALGIGLSVAMFSLVQAVVLNPLPFTDQASVHLVWKMDSQLKENPLGELAYPELADLQANPALMSVALIPAALYGNGRVLQAGAQEPVQIESCPTTPDLFRTLGVRPVLGRDFRPSDAGGAPVVILSDRVWREHFDARPSAIGQVIRLNGVGHTVIGVMDAAVDFPRGAGLWLPLRPDLKRGMTWLQAVARARPGVSPAAFQAAMERTFAAQYRDFPQEYSRTQHAVVTPIADFLTGSSKRHLLLSWMASCLLLLSAAVSASNLFLSRTLTRRREIATRLALGASPGQVLAQFAAEGVLAAGLATVAGGGIAYGAIRALVHWAPADIPRLEAAQLNAAAWAWATALAVLATLACLSGPALMLRDRNLDRLLRQARSAGSLAGARLQNAFVLAQAGLTVAILAVGLLLLLSYRAMLQTDVGFAHGDTLTMNLAARGRHAAPEARPLFYAELLRRLRLAPGVTSAAAVLLRPLEGPVGWDTEYSFEFEAGQRDPHLLTKANFEVVTPGYFATVGTPLLSGRDFDLRDTQATEKVIIISRSLAGRIRATGREPLGQRLRAFGAWRKVVGVAADARYRQVVEAMDDVYVPDRQTSAPTNYLVLRGEAPTAELLALVRRTLKDLDPSQTIAGAATLSELLERHTARHRFNLTLLLLFAAGAVVLAAAGIHSVIGETVASRAKELAVKSALGAGRLRLVGETTRAVLLFVGLGELAGLGAAWALGRAATGLLYTVSPSDPVVLVSVFVFVFAVAGLAALGPAWIAAGQDARSILQGD